MKLFEAVKEAVTARSAAEYYGRYKHIKNAFYGKKVL